MVAHTEFHYLLFSKAIWGKLCKEDVELLWLTLQSTVPIFYTLWLFDTLANHILLTKAWYSTLYCILVLICGSDNVEKQCVLRVENSHPVTNLQHDHQGDTGCKSYRCHTIMAITYKHICFSNTQTFLYQRRNCFGTYWHVLPVITKKQMGYSICIQLLPKRQSTP